MKSAIFSALVWAASSALLAWRTAALNGSLHMLRSLRGWAVAAFVIVLAMHWLRGSGDSSEESTGRQVQSAVSAFAVFAVLVTLLVAVRNSTALPWAGNALTLIGGCLAPVILLMGLEFPDLRLRAFAATGIIAAGLISFAGISTLTARPEAHPGPIRVHQPSGPNEAPRQTRAYFL